MKNRSHRPPLPTAPMDYWEDGSWTVDCSCGVTFDDGEEMVDCDECGVWVHTRCSGFVKGEGEASFTCEKCKVKRPRSSSSADQNGNRNNGNSIAATASNNEETEVAQLLVELPTKADPFPPLAHHRPAFRLWTQIPMEERVHVNGVPGGDPALFQGISSVFSSNLWNCAGYVPKKFNFKYKDFPCLDSDESENPANTGANLLFSLSKETVPYGTAELLAQRPSLRGSKRRDGKVLCNNGGKNSVKKDRNKLRVFSVSSGKRREEESVMGKGIGGKKKGMTCGYRTTVDNKKRGSTLTTDACKLDQDRAIHGSKPDFQGITSDDKGEEVSLEPPLITCHEGTDSGNNLEHSLATRTTAVVLSAAPGNSLSPEVHVKLEKLDDQDVMGVKISSRTSDLATTTHGTNHIGIDDVTEEDVDFDAVGAKQLTKGSDYTGILKGGSSAVEEEHGKLKHVSGELCSIASDFLDLSTHPGSNSAFAQGLKEAASKEESISEDVQAVGNLDIQGSSIDIQKLDLKNSSTLQVDQLSEDLQLHESVGVLESDIQKPQDAEMEPESGHQDCDKSREGKTSIHYEPKKHMQEQESPSGTVEMSEDLSERHSKSATKNSNSAVGGLKLIVSVGKGSSTLSQPDISKLPIVGSYKSPGTTSSTSTRTVPFSKRLKFDNGSVDKKDNRENVVSGVDTTHGGMSRQTTKTHPRSSGSLGDKTSQRKVLHVPVSKHKVANSKESSLCPSSKKTSSTEKSPNSSGSRKPPGSLKSQSTSVQLKFRTSGSLQRNERMSSSGTQTSGKLSNHSAAMHPPSSASTSATLSDEELAKRLHQELNSSPRVSRVPRGFPAIGMQSASSASTSMLSKRTSSSGGKYQVLVTRRKNKDETHGPFNEKDKLDHRPSSGLRKQEASVTTDGSENKDALKRLSDVLPSVERNAELAATTDDDSGPASRTLPGLVDEIMSKEKDLSYEDLCDAVLPHWPSLRKPNGERYAYSSHFLAVHDCLRNRSEWAHLIVRGPKVSLSKRGILDVDPSIDETEIGTTKSKMPRRADSRNQDPHREGYPRGKRQARKRRRLALQGRDVMDVRARQKQDAAGNDDLLTFSEESRSLSSEDEIQGTKPHAIISETSMSASEEDSD